MVIDSVTVTTSAQKLSALSSKVSGGVQFSMVALQADPANAGNVIYFGNSDVLTTKGYSLPASGNVQIFGDEADVLLREGWVIASAGTPRLNFVAQER